MKTMVRLFRLAVVLVLATLALGPRLATAAFTGNSHVKATLIAERTAVTPGQGMRVGLLLRHSPGWHTYWRNPGDSGLPTTVQIVAPSGWQAGDIEWPTPRRFSVAPLANFGYDGEVLLPFGVVPPAQIAGDTVTLRIKAAWLVCSDVCVPGEADLSLSLPVLPSSLPSAQAPLFARADAQAPQPSAAFEVVAHLDARELTLQAATTDLPRRVEFFPFESGLVANAAAHRLYRTSSGWQLRVVRPEIEPLDAAGVQRVAGLLVVDDTAFVLDAPVRRAPAPPASDLLASVSPLGATDAHRAPGTDAATGSASSTRAFWGAVALAFVGGLLLNLMPCVLPVVGLKVISLAQVHGSQQAPGRRASLALSYGLGVLVTLWALVAVVLALRSAGQAAGWGFQLQSPSFVAAMALLFFVIGLALLDVFPIRGPSLAGSSASGAGGSFLTGALGTLVATPCTAPFMAAAVGVALARPPAEALGIFTALGAGLALPVVLLLIVPGALAWLPRPGPWMQTLRHWLAFPMFASTLWLFWVLVRQTDAASVLTLGAGLVLLAAAAWTYGRYCQASQAGRARHRLAAVVALGTLGIGVAVPAVAEHALRWIPASDAAAQAQWEPYSEARLQALRAENRPVLVEFTADWCVICQVNKSLVLERKNTLELLAQHRVALMRADWTRRDPAITEALGALGRNGVPVYAVYLPGQHDARLLPEALTLGAIRQAIESPTAAPRANGVVAPSADASGRF